MLNRASNYSVIPNANEHYSATLSSPTPRPSASLPSDRKFNKVPARLRQASRVLDPPHIDATVSYQTDRKNGYHYYHHHSHHSHQYHKEKPRYQDEKGYKTKYDRYKYKSSKRVKEIPAPGFTTPKGEHSDYDSDCSGERKISPVATGSNKSKFGLRKVSCNSQLA